MQKHWKASLSSFALTAALVAMPGLVQAQQRPQQQPQPQQQQQAQACTAKVSPATVQSGQKAAEVTFTFSEAIGQVTDVSASDDSGIELAAASDLPRQELAAGSPAPRPIAMGDAANSWKVYLNTTDAKAGQQELTLNSSMGECKAQITVK